MTRKIPVGYYWISRELDQMVNCADRISYSALERDDAMPVEEVKSQFESMREAAASAISRLPPEVSETTTQRLAESFKSIIQIFNRRYKEAVA